MPVNEHTTHNASCDECEWFQDGFESEEMANQAIDSHIERDH